MAASKKAVVKKAAPAKKSKAKEPKEKKAKAPKVIKATKTGYDCFNRKISLVGKNVTLHDTGNVIICNTEERALAEFDKAVANTQFQ